MTDPRRALLIAALACTRLKITEPEVAMVRRWLDTWSGTGAVIVGMIRQGYDVSLTTDENGWRATFLHRCHLMQPWVGQVLTWQKMPWTAVQEAAWRALHAPFVQDYSLSDESPL